MRFSALSLLILSILCFEVVTPGCIYNERGICIEECPPDTVAYTSGCKETVSQRTCKEPEPRSLGLICDLSRCDCVKPKVWDEAISKCVLFEECTKDTTKDEGTS